MELETGDEHTLGLQNKASLKETQQALELQPPRTNSRTILDRVGVMLIIGSVGTAVYGAANLLPEVIAAAALGAVVATSIRIHASRRKSP